MPNKNLFNSITFFILCCLPVIFIPLFGCERIHNSIVEKPEVNKKDLAEENLKRSMGILDRTVSIYLNPQTFEMRRFYNPFLNTLSDEKASVWMYTSGVEAVNAVLASLKSLKENGNQGFYDLHYSKYADLLNKMYENADYYLGSFELISFTQTKTWSVYAVDRVNQKGHANVSGILNVYDDQMWLIRELLESYKITGNEKYLVKAEYLTSYVLDGWDVTLDENGTVSGGIPWGPGYTTKHACSNSPLISPLVWLYEIYKNKDDQIESLSIDPKDRKTRISERKNKSDYYLKFATDIYNWQKGKLLNSNGVYSDMLGGCDPNCAVQYEVVNGVKYRSNTILKEAVGEAYSYNSGTMLSGAVELFDATKDPKYSTDANLLAENSFKHFASLGKDIPQYYSFETDGFKNWFNAVLMRGYKDFTRINLDASKFLEPFQKNLDYGYDHFVHNGFLPNNLLLGWEEDKSKNSIEGMFMFTYAAQYAMLSEYYNK